MIRAGLLLFLVAAAGCQDNQVFAVGKTLDVCDGNYPSCNGTARCVLDEDHYITGDFPSARRFLFRTTGEEAVLIQIFLDNEVAAGTELRLSTFEPGCGDEYVFDTNGTDLFRAAGTDGILQIHQQIVRGGDHLVEFVSDSFCRYTLIWGQDDSAQ